MTETVAFRPKAHAYLTDHGSEHKKSKGTKKVCNKTETHASKFPRLLV